jgi:MYXO-CTERM domain-containing protein
MLKKLALALPVALAATTFQPQEADACGGCFVPPEENTVVTGHRMILSVGMTQSTLYDQIEYAGEPEDFGWVLPIVGTVDIGVSSDLIFNQLGFDSSVEVRKPIQECPEIYCDWEDDASFGAGTSGAGGAGGVDENGGVEVLAEETVGPYETVQLQADDPNALNLWLAENGYNVPTDVQPVIDAYVGDGFNFLAMKLAPGAGIDRMAPVRITTEGSNAVLPLRMVAAGTGATTTITLWLLGEGRYEPSNFPSFTIDPEHVVWNYDTSESNYADLRQSAYDASQGFGWLVESSTSYSVDAFRNNVLNVVSFAPDQSGYDDGTGDWEAIEAAAMEDLDVLFGGLDPASVHLTRVRAELSREALGTDLLVGAADDQSDVSRIIQTEQFEGTQPACPSPPPGCWYYDDTLNEGNGSDEGDQSGSCNVTSPPAPTGTAFGGIALVGLGIAMMRRRRRR